MRWLPVCFFILLCAACKAPSARQNANVRICLSSDSQSVYVSGLEYSVLQELKKESLTPDMWKSILPVYRMPGDTDLKDDQPEQPGTYQVKGTVIMFKPDTAFIKHEQYYVRFYGNSEPPLSWWKLIRGKANLRGTAYTEVMFKF